MGTLKSSPTAENQEGQRRDYFLYKGIIIPIKKNNLEAQLKKDTWLA